MKFSLTTFVTGRWSAAHLEKSGESERSCFKWHGPSARLQFDKRDSRIDGGRT